MSTETTPLEKAHGLFKNSITIKLITITILMLLLLIPASMIQSIIDEREQLKNVAVTEVSSKWAEAQVISGPILTIPVIYEYEQDKKTYTITKHWQILPEHLSIDGVVNPQKLKRSIHEVIVYESKIDISGDFRLGYEPDLHNLKEILFDQAFLTVGVTDLRGIKNQIQFGWDSSKLDVKPGSKLDEIIFSGFTVDLPDLEQMKDKYVSFSFSLELLGSKNLSFLPVGSTTMVTLNSPWKDPSFNGNFLPSERSINENGFNASWSILQLNRNFPQSWIGSNHGNQMREAAFGVDLILPLDDYQKSYRSAKYAAMTIALTFLIFFLVEILNKQKIHPFQYALVGLALCLFYVLLVSISEHSNFNFAYGISTLAVITMISLYSISVFKKLKLSMLLGTTITAIYSFLFVTMQLADYALLMGSLGLMMILSLTMYFTRNINWYTLNTTSKEAN